MDFLREIVGGPKKRFRQNGYNLDLTYITPRLIAMAFPASGFEKLYRNNIDTVCEVLQKYHNNKYLTINLSGRQVDEKKLKNVQSFEWEDHKAPALQVLFVICELIADFLDKKQQSVVAIHCNQGKGRTGTIICCFLLYVNFFNTSNQAIAFYAKQRFQQQGYGVTQPCQIKYIQYFQTLIKNPKLKPQLLILRKISFKGNFNLSQPYFKLKTVLNSQLILSTKKNQQVSIIEKQNEMIWKLPDKCYLVGDISLEVKDLKKIIGYNSIGNYTFNTIFVPQSKIIVVNLSQISPDSLPKSGYFDENFKMELHFKAVCECQPTSPLSERCKLCKQQLKYQQSKQKKIIHSIKNRQLYKMKGKQILYGSKTNIKEWNELVEKQ